MRPVADLGSLPRGSHLCAFYEDDGQLAQVASAFVASALGSGARILYVAGQRTRSQVETSLERYGVGAEAAITSGQLVVSDFATVYGSGEVDLGAVAGAFRTCARQAREDGFPALRVAAETADLMTTLGSFEELLRWERVASHLQQGEGISTVCQYDRRLLTEDDVRSLALEHTGLASDVRAADGTRLLAMRDPWGLRLVGELDRGHVDTLVLAVRARAAVDPRVTLDLTSLTFADVGTLRALYALADDLPDHGRIVLSGATSFVRRVIDLADFRHDRVEVRS